MQHAQWKTMDGKPIDLKEEIETLLKEGERVIHIGTDSQKVDKNIRFATCVVVLKPGKGGRVFYTHEKLDRNHFKGLRKKLFEEAWRSVTVALMLSDTVPEEVEMIVHIDANSNVRWESNQYIQELVGMVVGQGFDYRIKPDSWCASHCCDHLVKGKRL